MYRKPNRPLGHYDWYKCDFGGLTPVDEEADLRDNVLLAVHHKCPQQHQNALKVFFLNKCKEFVYDRYSCLTYFVFTKCFMSVFLKLKIIWDSYHLHFITKTIEAQRRWVLSLRPSICKWPNEDWNLRSFSQHRQCWELFYHGETKQSVWSTLSWFYVEIPWVAQSHLAS